MDGAERQEGLNFKLRHYVTTGVDLIHFHRYHRDPEIHPVT